MQSIRQTRGTETSQYPEEEKTIVIAQVVASERARAQTDGVTALSGLKDRQQMATSSEPNCLERQAIAGESPVGEAEGNQRRHLSSAGHEKSCMNPRGPSRKAKYYRETDSEPVL